MLTEKVNSLAPSRVHVHAQLPKLPPEARHIAPVDNSVHPQTAGGLQKNIGLTLARALADEGLVDEWITVLSPSVIGNRPVGERGLFRPVGGLTVCGDDVVAGYRVR